MRWGGGGTPSIDEPEGEKPKVFPQPEPVQEDVVIPDEDKVSWLDVITNYINEQKEIDTNYIYSLNGSGTESDPWQISSAMDFAFVSYNSLHFGNYKYFELTNDVVINDGYFEEDGTYHDGGDGKLYTLETKSLGHSYNFCGNGYTIFGLYFNDLDKDFAIFSTSIQNFIGFNFENLYLSGKKIRLVSFQACINVDNINIKSGFLKGNDVAPFSSLGDGSNISNYAKIIQNQSSFRGYFSGISMEASSMTNCKNYGDIEVEYFSRTFGLCLGTCPKMTKCENHGNITLKASNTDTNTYASLFAGAMPNAVDCVNYGNLINGNYAKYSACFCIVSGGTLQRCVNHGDIHGAPIFINSGGNSANGTLIDCINYGTVYNSKSFFVGQSKKISEIGCVNYGDWICDTMAPGNCGIFTDTIGIASIINCASYGTVNFCYEGGYNRFGIVGYRLFDGEAIIKNVKVDMNLKGRLGDVVLSGFSHVSSSSQIQKLRMQNLDINLNIETNTAVYLMWNIFTNSEYEINNVKIALKRVLNGNRIKIAAGNFVEGAKLNINSLMINEDNASYSNITLNNFTGKAVGKDGASINGVLSVLSVGNEKYKTYFGTDFSGFYVKWKTGEIGLKALDNVGVYMLTMPSEGYLQERGFEKIA